MSRSPLLANNFAVMQNLKEKIDQQYRVRLILDNLPVTTYDLEENPESVRPGYELGYERDGKRFINNHLMFKILVHQTNGQYTRAKENMAEIEAAAIVEVRLACMGHSLSESSHRHCHLAPPCPIPQQSSPAATVLAGRGSQDAETVQTAEW